MDGEEEDMESILRKKLGARGAIYFQRFLEENKKTAHIRVMIRVETNYLTEFIVSYKAELKRMGFTVNGSSGNVISGSIHPDNLIKVAQLIFVKKIDTGSPLFEE